MPTILILHGPNLNLLGSRETDIYGTLSLEEINRRLHLAGAELGLDVRSFQSNQEGGLIDALHEARSWAAGVVFNPAGYTHTSVALRDAVAADVPAIHALLAVLLAMPAPGPACTTVDSNPFCAPRSTLHLPSDQSTSRSMRSSSFQRSAMAFEVFVAARPVLISVPYPAAPPSRSRQVPALG